jgi:hypothetical protein
MIITLKYCICDIKTCLISALEPKDIVKISKGHLLFRKVSKIYCKDDYFIAFQQGIHQLKYLLMNLSNMV